MPKNHKRLSTAKKLLLYQLVWLVGLLALSCSDNGDSGAECGNGKTEEGEQCDGTQLGTDTCVTQGFDSGDLACAADCTFDTSGCTECGDGVADTSEDCDGEDLAGMTCLDRAYDGGALACNADCTFDESGCCDLGGVDPCEDEDCTGHGTCTVTDCLAACECDMGFMELEDLECSESTCLVQGDVPDPWVVTISAYDRSTGDTVEGVLVEVYGADDSLLESGTTDENGAVGLSIASGGKLIDGEIRASKDGYMPYRTRGQGGAGIHDTGAVLMAPENYADAFVEYNWGEARDPTSAIVLLYVDECNESIGVTGAAVTISQPGAGLIYTSPDGGLEPLLTDTTSYGMAYAANVPAGENTFTVGVGDMERVYTRSIEAGLWETLVFRPRSDAEMPECDPGDIDGYEPDWRPSEGLAQNRCTNSQILDYIDYCWTSGAPAGACQAWMEDPQNTTCHEVVLVPQDAPNWNGLVHFYEVGWWDCVPDQCVSAFEGDLTEESCGAKLAAKRYCTYYACKNNCPVRPDAGFDDDRASFIECSQRAGNSVCAEYQEAANACSQDLLWQGDPVDQCFWAMNETWQNWAKRFLILMCGNGQADGSGLPCEWHGDCSDREVCMHYLIDSEIVALCAIENSTGKEYGESCVSHDECKSRECLFNICSDLCGLDEHCPDGSLCSAFEYTNAPGVYAACRPWDGSAQACELDGDCPAGEVCSVIMRADGGDYGHDYVCMTVIDPGGQLGDDCGDPVDDSCYNNLCLVHPLGAFCTHTCRSTADCPAGIVCKPVAWWTDLGVCTLVFGSGDPCFEDVDCTEPNEVCTLNHEFGEALSGACQEAGSGASGPGGSCTVDEDCASFSCWSDVCFSQCIDNTDCTAFGLECVDYAFPDGRLLEICQTPG